MFIAIVGPSGAGKDTLLQHAAAALKDRGNVVFARRVITRTCDGQTEDHDTLTPDAFDEALQAGAFCISWNAHGLAYGLPSDLLQAARSGSAIVANVSRDVLEECLTAFGRLAIVEVAVEDAVLGQRIAARGRESGTQALERTRRSRVVNAPAQTTHIRIDNSGPLEAATDAFIKALNSLLPHLQQQSD